MPPKRRAAKKDQVAQERPKAKDSTTNETSTASKQKKSESQSLQEIVTAIEDLAVAPEAPPSPSVPGGLAFPEPESQYVTDTTSHVPEISSSSEYLPSPLPIRPLPPLDRAEADQETDKALFTDSTAFDFDWVDSTAVGHEEPTGFTLADTAGEKSPEGQETPQATINPIPSPLPDPPLPLQPMARDYARSPLPTTPAVPPLPSPLSPQPLLSVPTFPSRLSTHKERPSRSPQPPPALIASAPKLAPKTKKATPQPTSFPVSSTGAVHTQPRVEAIDGASEFVGVEWFKDPPPRSAPPPVVSSSAPSTEIPAMPSNEVMARNEMLIFALKASPSVLLDRFQQFGQLGVLGWCSEFSELVDDIKAIGFEGNMFTTTRDHALAACREILQVLRNQIQVNMQLIILFMSSQVARLRRFLDDEHEFDDYPIPDFPLPTD